ncbi:MAG: hypothetical protein JNL08_06230 [Planctomycetes bacterium]|nr:hypothetical protein [Planctomycetota bacterium]
MRSRACRALAAVACLSFGLTPAFAQLPQLVADTAPGPAGSMPYGVTHFGRFVLYGADDGTSGIEPWISDGTPAGTFRLGDLNPGPMSSYPGYFTVFGSAVLFQAYVLPFGHETWITDGTAVGTQLLVDLAPGLMNSNPHGFVVFRDRVLFVASNGSGERVWQTDGTAAGTVPHPVVPANAALVGVFGHRLCYTRRSGNLHEFWLWDGVAAPVQFASFAQVASMPEPYVLGEFGDRILFVPPPTAGAQIWSSDGTAASNTPITQPAARIRQHVAMGGAVYYLAESYFNTVELRATDGTLASDRGVAQFANWYSLVASADRLFLLGAVPNPFPIPGSQAPERLWVSDGSTAGTTVLSTTLTGVRAMTPVGSRQIAFVAREAATGDELWRSDGTVAGTTRLTDLSAGAASTIGALAHESYGGGRLWFAGDDGVHGTELYTLHTGAGNVALGHGCGGAVELRLQATDPVLGAALTLYGRGATASAPGLVAITPPAAVPNFVVPGCLVHVDLSVPAILWPFTADPAGTFTAPPLPVPNAAFLDGVVFAAQAVSPWPGAPLFDLALSGGVLLTLGQ